ncbi:MAG TPA: hypothetical protein VFV58_24110 [Blastocatellia bacterium]|jgi:hypothetical protein|nr:hypothetical protein [Blastocatellia bacterium]
MTLQQIKQAAEIAKTRTNDKRWIAAIDRAVTGFESWIVTELHDHILVTTENGTYHANGVCQCKAYTDGGKQACKHRALYRLIQIANEETAPAVSLAEDVAASPRQNLIAEIENIWNRVEITPLAVALMARFGKNRLEMLDDDMLRRVRLAIAL